VTGRASSLIARSIWVEPCTITRPPRGPAPVRRRRRAATLATSALSSSLEVGERAVASIAFDHPPIGHIGEVVPFATICVAEEHSGGRRV